MPRLTDEQQERTERLVDQLSRPDVVCVCKERFCIHWQVYAVKVLSPLLDSDSQAVETFAASHFTFGPCFHSMVKPDCPSCCRSHAIRMEEQLGKLEASTALPLRERIEKAVREHVAHCYQVYKGVPPSVKDWIGGAVHYVMWGLDRDIPLKPDAATAVRDKCVAKVRAMRGEWHDQYIAADSSTREALVRKEMLFAQCCAARDIIKELEALANSEQER